MAKRKPGGRQHKHQDYGIEIYRNNPDISAGGISKLLDKDLGHLPEYASTDHVMSMPAIYRLIKKEKENSKKVVQDEYLNKAFLHPSINETLEWIKKEHSQYTDIGPLMLNLLQLIQSVVIGSKSDKSSNEIGDKETGTYFPKPVRPLVLRHQAISPEYLPVTISNRHALWVYRIDSATHGLTLLDQLMFAMEFAKRERFEEEPVYDDLWTYIAYRPWSSKQAAVRYWNSIVLEDIPPLSLTGDHARNRSIMSTGEQDQNSVSPWPADGKDYLLALWIRWPSILEAKFGPVHREQSAKHILPDLLPSQSLGWSMPYDKPHKYLSVEDSENDEVLYGAEQDYLKKLTSPLPEGFSKLSNR